jgi:hypothetical protein
MFVAGSAVYLLGGDKAPGTHAEFAGTSELEREWPSTTTFSAVLIFRHWLCVGSGKCGSTAGTCPRVLTMSGLHADFQFYDPHFLPQYSLTSFNPPPDESTTERVASTVVGQWQGLAQQASFVAMQVRDKSEHPWVCLQKCMQGYWLTLPRVAVEANCT